MDITSIVGLFTGIALFLFGMTQMGDGLKKVAGSKLEMILYKLTSTPLKGVLLGTGVTAVIQSSSATSIMVVGFVNSGMMKVRQAIGIILGAFLGTSVTGWIICLSEVGGGGSNSLLALLSTSTITGVVAVIGIILRMFSKNRTKQHVGDILLGFTVLMTGMSVMSGAVSALKEDPAFVGILTSFSNPVLGILAGALITAVLQSASAACGILQALSVTGAIRFESAIPILLGVAIGAAVPIVISAIGASVNGKRTAMVYPVIDLIGIPLVAILFYTANAFAHFSFMSLPVDMFWIAVINSLFRFAILLLLIPLIGLIEKILNFIVPSKNDENEDDTLEIDRLEDRFIKYPAIAIEQSNTAVCSMARKARKNLNRAFEIIHCYNEQLFNRIQEKEEVIDRYEDKLGTYLIKLNSAELTPDQSREISKFLHTISDFERIGDHAVNLSNVAKEINEKNLTFSPLASAELDILISAVSKIVVLATDAFTNDNLVLASQVEPLEEVIDALCDEIKIRHIKRVQVGDCTLSHGFVFNDLLTNYERIADHCSNIAVAMIELHQDSFDTHEYLNDIKTAHSETFNKYYELFDKEFNLNNASEQ